MRPKIPCYLLTFDTTVAAMNFETYSGAHSIPGRLIPLPREISAGCGMAWKTIRAEAPDHFRENCEASGIPIAQLLEMTI